MGLSKIFRFETKLWSCKCSASWSCLLHYNSASETVGERFISGWTKFLQGWIN